MQLPNPKFKCWNNQKTNEASKWIYHFISSIYKAQLTTFIMGLGSFLLAKAAFSVINEVPTKRGEYIKCSKRNCLEARSRRRDGVETRSWRSTSRAHFCLFFEILIPSRSSFTFNCSLLFVKNSGTNSSLANSLRV